MANSETPESLEAVLAKRKTLERHVLQLLDFAERDIEQTPGDDAERERINRFLDELHMNLQELLDLKIEGRFFDDIVEVAPQSETTVDKLREDHEELLASLDALRIEVKQPGHLPHIGRLLHGWHTRFCEFNSREIELIQNAWNIDTGTMD